MAIGQDRAQAVAAFNRFGFGARPGDLDRAVGDPRGFLLAELRAADVALIRNGALPGGVASLQAFYLDQQSKRAEREKIAMTPPAEKTTPDSQAKPEAAKPGRPKPPGVGQALFRAEASARLTMQLDASAGFVERLVAFWSNHFAVSVAKSAESAHRGRAVRARSDPSERARANSLRSCGRPRPIRR